MGYNSGITTMGGRAGGGARSGGGGAGARGEKLYGGMTVKQHYDAMSPKERYKETQDVANQLQKLANTNSWNDASYYPIAQDVLHGHMQKIAAKGGFAGDVAKTIDSQIYSLHKGRTPNVANMSSKQAWALGQSVVSNGIDLGFNTTKTVTVKVQQQSKHPLIKGKVKKVTSTVPRW